MERLIGNAFIMDINFEILPLVSLKHIVVASHESFCKNLVDYFRQAALVTYCIERLPSNKT
ncbi:hypothetical protein CWATWH0003_0114 [Crocosphaera watsonii WH 0003]|uniref:Uncharacterized protein n=1 Tax=Crocosphaera watsonii WH 0003 TaxID=423471 RepID=G5IXV9_CROWT|nr:hypothetical protein CWATWH0003_0114 [Crocosphaera watsonii WH 0003]